MTDSGPMAQPLGLWLTDRSRYEAGVLNCPRARWHRYHDGNHGYGWDTIAQSMPTVTGTLVHQPITAIMAEVQRTDAIPSPEWVYQHAIAPAVAAYEKIVETRGLANILDADTLALRSIEQTTLLEGLTWVWYYGPLQAYHEQYQVKLIEAELPVVLGCTCGLGDRISTLEAHDGRGCTGIGYMTRGDMVARHRVTGTYRYDEIKTTGEASLNWCAAWPYRAQIQTGVLGAEQQLDVTIDEVWIHGLVKGSHKASWDPELKKNVGPKYQQSVLCYGYRRPANPPLYGESWAPKFNLPPDPVTGKGKRLGKDYQRTGVWELPAELWAKNGALSPSHYWCQALLAEGMLGDQYVAVGPIMREAEYLNRVVRQIVGEEGRRQVGAWAVYEAIQDAGGDRNAPGVMAALDAHWPMAGGDACHSYFGSQCPYVKVCWGNTHPEDGGYVMRRPHHAPELEQAMARGCLPPAMGAAEEGEE